MDRYRPPDALEFPRFAGIRTFMRLPHVQTTEGVDVAIVGLPFDTGATFRVGARFGPEAIRSASVLLRPYHPVLRVHLFERLSIVDYGDAPVAPGFIEDSLRRIADFLSQLTLAGVIPIGLGGDHSVLLGELRAVAAAYGPVALVQFDSHPDTWDAYFGHRYTHGTVVRRAIEEGLILPERSIQVGLRGPVYGPEDWEAARRLGLEVMSAAEVRAIGLESATRRILQRVGDHPAFLSFDIDFFDPAYAPGTGTPEVGGFTSWEGLSMLRELVGLPLVGMDVVEVLPAYDPGGITALLAANVVYEGLALLAARRREGLPHVATLGARPEGL
ncbi:agmatinase [Thermoflexus sp.]|uniref:agmatinase n=1 Tax=Thermoflexus sp. TaxID=1969742 RepID=UPI0035E4598C